MPKKTSAALLMYRRANNQLEFFLVHPGGPYWVKKDLGNWSVPKGEVEEGETDLLTVAKREFKEETGTEAHGNEYIELGTVMQKNGKTIHGWAFEGDLTAPFECNTCTIEWPPHSGKMIEIPECDRGEFFNAETAKQKIHPPQADFIFRLETKLGGR